MAVAPIIEKLTGFGQSTTSGAGPVLIAYTTTPGKHSYQVWCQISAVSTGSTEGAGYILAASFRNLGTLVQVGGTTAILNNEDDSNYGVNINDNGDDIEVQTTGIAATTIDWVCSCRILVSVSS